jgi:AraC-like DNA-binding protein
LAVVIDTRSAAPADPVEFWRGEASRVFQPLSVHCDDRSAFWARSVAHDLCDITLTRTRSEASTIVRTERAIAEFDPGRLMLVLHVRGSYHLTRGGDSDVCGPGDMAIFDSSRPFAARSDGPIDVVTVALSKSLLRPDLARAAARSALRIPGDSGPAALVRPYVAGLLDGLHDGEIASDDESVADCVVSLVCTLFADSGVPRAARRGPLSAVKRYIDEHLGDPALTPEGIAAAHYISRRQLYTLFEAESSGVREWIRERRLERCRHDLRDPALEHETVTSIAMRWGFVDPSHFSHCFRDVYGMPPREYRLAAR